MNTMRPVFWLLLVLFAMGGGTPVHAQLSANIFVSPINSTPLGGTLNVSYTVTNTGPQARTFGIGAEIRLGSNLVASLPTQTTPTIQPNSQWQGSFQYPIPCGWETGNYTFRAAVWSGPPGGSTWLNSYDRGFSIQSQTIAATITVAQIASVPAGSQLTASYTVTNTGTCARSFGVGGEIRQGATLLATLPHQTTGVIQPGNVWNGSFQYTIPSSWPGGTYTFRAAVWSGTPSSSTWLNSFDRNFLVQTIAATINVATITSRPLGQTLTANYTVANTGNVARSFGVGGEIRDGNTVLVTLPHQTTPTIQPNNNWQGSFQYQLPCNWASGSRTFRAAVWTGTPGQSTWLQSHDRTFTIQPEVVAATVSVSPISPATAGSQISVSYTVTNTGSCPRSFGIGAEVRQGSTVLATLPNQTTGVVQPGNNWDGNYQYTVPATWTPGTYTFRAAAWNGWPGQPGSVFLDSNDQNFTVNVTPLAQIVGLQPPTGQRARDSQVATSVTVRNNDSVARSYWVGLSFAHQSTNNEAWPVGWYDIKPLQTQLLAPGGQQTLIFTSVIPANLRPGQYYARASTWLNFNTTTYLMEERLDDSSRYPQWQTVEMGLTSFSLGPYPYAPNSIALLDQLRDIVQYVSQQPMDYLYHVQGTKPLLTVNVGRNVATVFAIPISASGTVLIDLADLLAVTPEAEDDLGWVTVWVDGSAHILSASWSLLPIPIEIGIIMQPSTFSPWGAADHRPGLSGSLGSAALFGWAFTGVSWDSGHGWQGPRFEWNGTATLGLSASVLSPNIVWYRKEVRREALVNAILAAQGSTLPLWVDDLAQRLSQIQPGPLLREATMDDGDWPLYDGQFRSNLSMAFPWDNTDNFGHYFKIDLPAGMSTLNLATNGGTENPTIYIRHGNRPTTTTYDEISIPTANGQSLQVTAPQAGRWHVLLAHSEPYSGVNLVATWDVHMGACCFANGACEVLASAACSSQGGTYRGDGTSCGTGGACPDPTGACCLPTGTCSEFTAAICATQNGTYRGDGTFCSSTACDGACCLPAGGCAILILSSCVVQGGDFRGYGTTCPPTPPCSQPPPTPPVPQVTYPSCGTARLTVPTPPNDIHWYWQDSACDMRTDLGFEPTRDVNTSGPQYLRARQVSTGAWSLNCSSVQVQVPTCGACCLDNGVCTIMSQVECEAEWGAYLGHGTSCGPGGTCPLPTGACCMDYGLCIVQIQNWCVGEWLGPGTTCAANTCLGACCTFSGACIVTYFDECLGTYNGDFRGIGTTCPPNPACPGVGACCFAGGSCEQWSESNCVMLGGVYYGDGSECAPGGACPQDRVLYVRADASPGGSGATWSTAFTDLQDALDLARVDPSVISIWVAAGTYRPDRGTLDRLRSFELITDVGLYGGFAGTETQLEERDWRVNPTVLDGDLLGDNLVNQPLQNRGDDTNNIVVVGYAENARLDGFTIRNSWAISSLRRVGGGVWNEHGMPLTIANCVFEFNDARDGSAVWSAGSPTIINTVFSNNRAGEHGAALMLSGNGTPRIVNCLFNGNYAHKDGGAIAVFDDSNLLIVNSTVFGSVSRTGQGGGVYVSPHAAAILHNSILWGNVTGSSSGEEAQLFGTTIDVHHSAVQGWSGQIGGVGNHGGEPHFVDPSGPPVHEGWGVIGMDLRLGANSYCIDSGENAAIAQFNIATDLNGDPRFHDDPGSANTGSGTPPIVDMGCYEFQGTSCYANCDGSATPPVLNVDDFTCFINAFAAAQSLPHMEQIWHYANCDGSTLAPVLNVDDFTCFINAFAQGCP